MSTTKTTLPTLPLEILQQIADCVETVHRPSLHAFSLTSKACLRATSFLIFRNINITARDREGLRRDVDRLVEALSRVDSFRHVRRITIKGTLRLNGKKADRHDNPHQCWLRQCGIDEILVDEELVDYFGHHVVYDEGVIKESSEDMAWAPVVSLLQAITHLKDLIYDCRSQFPPSLLRTLHKRHPRCRLHHPTFRFRTLLWGVPYPYEMELATSPSLHSVKVTCVYQDSDADFDFNLEAVRELAAGLAPNLKEVTTLHLYPCLPASQRSVRKPTWQGLPGFTSDAVGSLTSLLFKGFKSFCSPTELQNWARHTDFAYLQQLALGGSHLTQACALSGETMEWIVQNLSFPCLRSLSVYLTRDDMFDARPHYSQNAISFFQAFDSLEELSINGPMDLQITDAVLTHHGQTLKKLTLNPFEDMQLVAGGRERRDIPMEFTKNHILQIQSHCPVLEELALPVLRNKSSASETEISRCFSGMKSLRFLFLTLECANWRISMDTTYNPQFDGEDDDIVCGYRHFVKRGHVKEAFINSAVDEALVMSIWNTITQHKAGRPLERLKLWTKGGGSFEPTVSLHAVETIAKCMSRSWLIERGPRNDDEDVSVRELGRRARETEEQESRYRSLEELDVTAGGVFRSIWPGKGDSGDWRESWSSFPLEG